MSDKKSGSWVKAGRKYDADIYIDLETGETKHIGTKLTSDDPKLYDGEPSLKGKIAGDILKTVLGSKK